MFVYQVNQRKLRFFRYSQLLVCGCLYPACDRKIGMEFGMGEILDVLGFSMERALKEAKKKSTKRKIIGGKYGR